MVYETQYLSPVGPLTIRSDGQHLTGISFEETSNTQDCPILEQTKSWLDAYFSGLQIDASTLPLKPEGTDFQKAVWSILRTIPYGHTLTYGQIARQLDEKMSAQAVGQAVGRNPIAIVIPCHRVLGAKGKITGFSGGLEKKRTLLNLEHISYTD